MLHYSKGKRMIEITDYIIEIKCFFYETITMFSMNNAVYFFPISARRPYYMPYITLQPAIHTFIPCDLIEQLLIFHMIHRMARLDRVWCALT